MHELPVPPLLLIQLIEEFSDDCAPFSRGVSAVTCEVAMRH